jgi:hypothetical protein
MRWTVRPQGQPDAAGAVVRAVLAMALGISVRDGVVDDVRSTASILQFFVPTIALAAVVEPGDASQ